MRPSGIGGMAVIEGVMIKNKDIYAVAVRKTNNEISVVKNIRKDFSDKVKLFKVPIFRGVLALMDSLVVGAKVMNYSAGVFEEEEEKVQNGKKKANIEKKGSKKVIEETSDFEIEEVSTAPKNGLEYTEDKENIIKKNSKINALLMLLAVLFSVVISVALFMVLPVIITNLLADQIKSSLIINLSGGMIRLIVFIGFVILATKMPEIKRVFMYHGAEHKTINCLESGLELTVQNVKSQSIKHKRCGTNFLLLVILISLILFMLLPSGNLAWRLLSRILLIPIIAGVSYEFVYLAGKSNNKLVSILSVPVLWLQGLTIKEPDDSMIEVAIKSMGAVLDGREQASIEKNANTMNQKGIAMQENTLKSSNLDIRKINPIQNKKLKEDDEEEDDEILKALDKFFDSNINVKDKVSGDK